MRVSTREGWRSSPLSWRRTRARSRYLKTPRYVPDGLSASDWAARQQKEKAAKVQNKAKYPKGAPQVPARRLGSFFFSRRDGVARHRHAVAAMASSERRHVARRRRDGVVVGVVLRHWHPVEHRHHVVARRSSA